MYSYKKIFLVSLPVVLMLLAQTIVQIAGTIFVSGIGLAEQKAVAMAGIYYIAFFTVCFGFSIGGQIMISRRNGEENYTEIGGIVIQGVLFLEILAVILFAGSWYVLNYVLKDYMDEADVYANMKEYLSWRMFGFFFASIAVMFRAFYVGIARTFVLTLNACVMTVVNIFLDYSLIFGKFGFPELGVAGAGIAAIVSEFISVLFFFVYTKKTVNLLKYGFHKMKFKLSIIKRILKISSFTMVQNLVSMLTWFMFFMFMQHKTALQLSQGVESPEDGLGITTIVRTVYMVFFVSISAFSTTANTLVGNTMGRGEIDKVIPLITRISMISVLSILGVIGIVLADPQYTLSFFARATPEIVPSAIPALRVVAFGMPMIAISAVVFSAISGTGNTKSALIIETIALAVYTFYMYYIVLVQQASAAVGWTVEYVYWGGLLIGAILYFKFGKWQDKQV